MKARVIGANLIVSIKGFYREKSTLFFTIAFPILLILLFGAIFSNQDNATFDLYIQDMDHTQASANLTKALELNGTFIIHKVDSNITDTAKFAKDNKINLVLVIKPGYEKAWKQRLPSYDPVNHTTLPPANPNANITIIYIYDPSSSSANTKIQILNSVFSGMNQKFAAVSPFFYSKQQSFLLVKYRYIEFFTPGIIAMSVMTSSLFGTVNVNAELRQKGVLRKLSTTPITRAEWILSNILYQFILALISTMAILLVAYGVFNVSLSINAWLLIFIILDVFAFAGIGMLLTRFAREAESAYAAANAIMFPMMFLSGSFFPLEMMPSFLKTVAQVLPLYYVNEGLRTTMVFQDNVLALTYAAVIGIFALVVFIVGIFVTSWKEGD